MNTMNQEELSFELEEPMEVVGPATSDWQMNPLRDSVSDRFSDWGRELAMKNQGDKSGIRGTSNPEDLPKFHREYDKIIDRAKEVGSNAFRLSFDFGRLCPFEGVFDEGLMAEYVRILANCKSKGIEPIITLHHWTAPVSFGKCNKKRRFTAGPLEHPEIVNHFNFYVNNVTDFLCDPVKIRSAVAGEGYSKEFVESLCDEKMLARWFITINEPANLLFTPYLVGEFPPYQKASFRKFPKLRKKVKAMHDQGYDILHEKAERAQIWAPKVGIAHVTNYPNGAIPFYESTTNLGLAEYMEEGSQSDFMGLQYYFRIRLGLAGLMPVIYGSDPKYRSDHPAFGQIYPAGIYDVLKYAGQKWPNKELMVTEFGFADKTDRKRPSWLIDTLGYILKAKKEGVPVSGALVWSIINNFEWCLGMDAPFGLFDKDGNRLQSDDDSPGTVSSREVWTAGSKHMKAPTAESAEELQKLRQKAFDQLNNSTAIQKVSG